MMKRVPCDKTVPVDSYVLNLPCALGKGHNRPCVVERAMIDAARMKVLAAYRAALERIADAEEDCMADDAHAVTTRGTQIALDALAFTVKI